MTSQAWNHLKLMAEKIRDKKGEIQRLIVHSMGDDGESASGSGEGNVFVIQFCDCWGRGYYIGLEIPYSKVGVQMLFKRIESH